MEDISKYVGIVHQFNGDTFENCDCIGLCRLFYKEHGWEQDFTDGKPVEPDWQKKDPFRLARYLNSHFTKTKSVEDLRFGDVVLFNIYDDYHLGLYLEYGKMLAMQVPVMYGVSMSTVYRRNYWTPFFVRGYLR